MAQYFTIHPDDPPPRLVRRAADILRGGGVAAWPTDSSYALGCRLADKRAAQRIRRIRQLDERHHFTLMCRDLSDIATYARVDDAAYRLLRAHTPGPYTFVLRASREVPRWLQNPRRRTLGLRVPDHRFSQELLVELGSPLMSVTLILPGDTLPLNEPREIRRRLEHDLDLVVDCGRAGGIEPTSIVDLTGATPVVLRRGRGVLQAFGG